MLYSCCDFAALPSVGLIKTLSSFYSIVGLRQITVDALFQSLTVMLKEAATLLTVRWPRPAPAHLLAAGASHVPLPKQHDVHSLTRALAAQTAAGGKCVTLRFTFSARCAGGKLVSLSGGFHSHSANVHREKRVLLFVFFFCLHSSFQKDTGSLEGGWWAHTSALITSHLLIPPSSAERSPPVGM